MAWLQSTGIEPGRYSMNKTVLYAFPLALALFPMHVSHGEEAGNPGMMTLPSARSIPGLTVEDPFPRGCVDCHINMPERNQDERLSTLMSRWSESMESVLMEKAQAVMTAGIALKGVHPKADDSLKDIPAACLSCHDRMSTKAPPLVPLLHAIHLTGGDANHYLTIFQGECSYCHKLDKQTGRWSVPSAPEQ